MPSERGWLLPQARRFEPEAGIYLVGTPIGNLGDITLRALDVLAAADVIACEDTRVTKKLLSYYGITGAKLVALADHNEAEAGARVVAEAKGGKVVAVVSDAGMPLISDPGFRLVKLAQDAGVALTSIPGASSVLAALQLSGMPSDRFAFSGFVPAKQGARQSFLSQVIEAGGTQIVFETARRLDKTLAVLVDLAPDMSVCVARELTKLFEECRNGTPQELLAHYDAQGLPKGEIVLVLDCSGQEAAYSQAQIDDLLRAALAAGDKPKVVAKNASKKTGFSVSELYERIVALKE